MQDERSIDRRPIGTLGADAGLSAKPWPCGCTVVKLTSGKALQVALGCEAHRDLDAETLVDAEQATLDFGGES